VRLKLGINNRMLKVSRLPLICTHPTILTITCDCLRSVIALCRQLAMPGDHIRLLALDGGGVRGLSSLMILQQYMTTVNPESPPKPCDYFDMIGGTSTGGLIAIMLGRLQMTVDECIEAYTSLSDKVFEKKFHRVSITGKLQGRFEAAALENAIKRILVERHFDEDTLLKDSPDAHCKVYVILSLLIPC